MSRPDPLNEAHWEGIFRELTRNEREMLLARLREKQPVSPVTDDPLPWMIVSELRIRSLVKKTKHLNRWKALSLILLVMNVISLGLWALVAPTLNPPILVRLGIAADVASELIMSEEEAIAAGIPGAPSGNTQIPDDIPNPEFFGRIYPQGTAFVKTQGPHGADYGHAAIDYAAGSGVYILSPINGVVTAKYVDGYGNPTLVIENKLLKVTMLHMSAIHVQLGDRVQAGQHVANEGNLGYSLCSDGEKPNGRDCGYHVHIDVDHQVLGQLNAADYLDRYLGGK